MGRNYNRRKRAARQAEAAEPTEQQPLSHRRLEERAVREGWLLRPEDKARIIDRLLRTLEPTPSTRKGSRPTTTAKSTAPQRRSSMLPSVNNASTCNARPSPTANTAPTAPPPTQSPPPHQPILPPTRPATTGTAPTARAGCRRASARNTRGPENHRDRRRETGRSGHT